MKCKLASFALCAAFVGALTGFSTYANAQVLDDNSLGSFLVFPKFDIRGETSTELRIVNNGESSIRVKVNYVCPGVKNVNQFCAALDNTLDFTAHQTRVIDVGDAHPPCNQGYAVAYALLGNTQTAVSYNQLSGSYHVYSGRRHETDNAISVQSTQAAGTSLGSAGRLRFGGGDYAPMGTNLYTDFRAVSFGTGEEADVGSRLTLLTLDTLAGMQNPPAVAFINFWNAAEVPFSTSVEYVCWTERQLDVIDANFIEDNLGTTTGSMVIIPFPNCPLPGGCPPLVPFDPTMLGSLEEYGDGDVGGHTLYHDQTPKATAYQPR